MISPGDAVGTVNPQPARRGVVSTSGAAGGTLPGVTVPANWYPDPGGTSDLRWWDGTTWTEHLRPNGPVPAPPGAPQQPSAPSPQQGQPYDQYGRTGPAGQQYGQAGPVGQQPYGHGFAGDRVGAQAAAEDIQRGVRAQQSAGMPQQAGYGSPMTEQVLVVNQKRKLIELTNEYAVMDSSGRQIGAVVEVGQSTAKKVMRFVSSLDQFFTHTLHVRDTAGNVQLILTRPAKVMKSTVIVGHPQGGEIGRLVQRNVFGKIRFGLESQGQEIGSLNAENWRAWNFSIQDHTGTEVARITKTFEGVMTTLFTTADSYVVHIHRPLTDPLRSLVVASALTVDTALKQDSRGFG